MSITEILSQEKVPAAEKLEQVKQLVGAAREAYGNADVEIPCKKVGTAHGYLPFNHLENDSKVELLLDEAMRIKSEASTFAECNVGAVLKRKVEELLATNEYFTNISTDTKFEYL